MRVVVADDQLINIEVIKSQVAELGLTSCCSFCINGQETIDTVKSIVELALANRKEETRSLTPVNFLLLDF
jgi:hypothetical protein